MDEHQRYQYSEKRIAAISRRDELGVSSIPQPEQENSRGLRLGIKDIERMWLKTSLS
jgi:hypothetical protein